MLEWLKSPRGSTAAATAVVTVLACAWFAPWPGRHPTPIAATPAAATNPIAATTPDAAPQTAASLPAANRPPVADSPQQVVTAETALQTAQGKGEAIADPRPAPSLSTHATNPDEPAFDIVRVEPNGDSVMAGRAAPNSSVELADYGKVVASIKADLNGQFALLPPPLSAGDHYLTLQVAKPDGSRVVSTQAVAVSVGKAGGQKPMVAMLAPGEPARVLSDGSTSPESAASSPATRTVAIQSVEAGQGGEFTASGVARAGSQCRVYLNGAYLADVTAGHDGRWSLKVAKGMKPGRYTVRADQLDQNNTAVVNRAEVPFDYPLAAALAQGERQLLAKGSQAPIGTPPETSQANPALLASNDPASGPLSDASPAVIGDLQTAKVTRGDSLWRISRKMLGHGVQYTEIYSSNAAQIKDPKLIYPGQVFVMPNHAVN